MKVLNSKLWRAFKISAIVFAVLAILQLTLSVLKLNGIFLFFGGFDTTEIQRWIYALLMVMLLITLGLLLHSILKEMVAELVVCLLFPIVAVASVLIVGLTPDYEYFTLTSPDGKHEIIVKEQNFLLGGWGQFYEKTSSVTMTKLKEYNSNTYQAVSSELYDITWHDDGFTFSFYTGNDQTEVLEIKYCD